MDEGALRLLERVRRQAMPGGPVACRGTWVRQRGELRLAPAGRWLPFRAEQRFDADGIDFRWEARVRMAPLVSARVVDVFERGAGRLVARLLGIVPVADARGPETDVGEALRGLAELPWRPSAFREGPPFTWEVPRPGVLRASFDDGRTRASVELAVDGEGRVTGVRAPSRPRQVGKAVVATPWSGEFGDYRTFGALRVPATAEATWHLPEGPFTYWRGRVEELRILG